MDVPAFEVIQLYQLDPFFILAKSSQIKHVCLKCMAYRQFEDLLKHD
jgi:hypothetical protein